MSVSLHAAARRRQMGSGDTLVQRGRHEIVELDDRRFGRELAEASRQVRPQRLLDAGHPFRHPQLEPALRHLLGRDPP